MRRVHLPPFPAMVRCALLAAGASGALIASAPAAAQVRQYPLDSPKGLHLHNVTAEPAVLQGKNGLRVTISPEAERRFQDLG